MKLGPIRIGLDYLDVTVSGWSYGFSWTGWRHGHWGLDRSWYDGPQWSLGLGVVHVYRVPDYWR